MIQRLYAKARNISFQAEWRGLDDLHLAQRHPHLLSAQNQRQLLIVACTHESRHRKFPLNRVVAEKLDPA